MIELIRAALAEDVGSGDVTTAATVDPQARARALITQKAEGVIYGIELAVLTFLELDPTARAVALADEGRWRAGGEVLEVRGRAGALLTAERTALNFLAHLSGVATAAARCVHAVEGTGVTILDTRKTTPGLRALEKAAVAAGGARNHRAGLYDAFLIKENHVTAAGGIAAAVQRARGARPDLPVEVEVRDLDELEQALGAGADRVLLDNMSPAQLTAAVRQAAGRVQLEASGGMTLQTLREHALTGVQFISVGAITHSAAALDLSLILEPLP